MKSFFATSIVVFISIALRAQPSIQPGVINIAGIDGKINDVFITTSIGEPAITTITSSKGSIITQGLLQPEILPCVDVEFRYYPNPAKDWITIEAYGCEVRIESMDIVDMWGRLITTALPTSNNELSLGELAQGVYLIKVKLSNQDVHTIPVVKTTN